MMDEYSTEQLIAARKVLDDMLENVARLIGGMEAIRILFPFMSNVPEYWTYQQQLRNAIQGQMGMPLFKGGSDMIGAELEKRKKQK